MRTLLSLAAFWLCAGLAQASPEVSPNTEPATVEKKLSAAQQRMVNCNKTVGDKRGTDRKAYMSECLKKK